MNTLRVFFVPGLVALTLVGVIWVLAWLFGGQFNFNINAPAGKGHGIPCQKDQELNFATKKVCIYICPDGEKTRIEGIERCLQEIEL